MNIYGKEASAFYDLHAGLRMVKRGDSIASSIEYKKNDPLVEELEEFAAAARGAGQAEMNGERATASLAVIRASILSAKEGRRVTVAEVLA